MTRVIKPISVREVEHELLLSSAKSLNLSLRDYVESILVLYMVMVNRVDGIQFMVPQKVNSAKPFAMSKNIGNQVKTICTNKGVSQVNFIYSAFMWHNSIITGEKIS